MHRNGLAFIRTVEGGEEGAAGQASGKAGAENGSNGTAETATFEPITSQDQLEKVLGDRLTRERSKFADYKDLKSKAKAFDELEESKKSAEQKMQDQIATLARERDEALQLALRDRIAAKFSISEEDADLFLTGSDQETLIKQAERLAGREADRRKKGNTVPSAGGRPQAGANDDQEEREATRSLFA